MLMIVEGLLSSAAYVLIVIAIYYGLSSFAVLRKFIAWWGVGIDRVDSKNHLILNFRNAKYVTKPHSDTVYDVKRYRIRLTVCNQALLYQ